MNTIWCRIHLNYKIVIQLFIIQITTIMCVIGVPKYV